MKTGNNIFEILFKIAGQGMLVCDKNGKIELINPMLNQMFGYKEDELINQSIEILIPDNLRKIHQHHRLKYNVKPADRQMGSGLDLFGKKKDGNVFSVEVGLTHCEIKREFKVVAIITDITERVTAQNKLKELNIRLKNKVNIRTQELEKSQKLYSLISRNFPRGIINVFDKDLNYVFAEGQELDRLGLSSEVLMGKNYTLRYHHEISKDVHDKFKSVFSGVATSFEFKDNDEFYAANAVPLKTSSGAIDQILVIEKNITDAKLSEQEMVKNLEKERELNELKTRFVSMASHEFRTPLSTILSSATLAQKYQTTDQQPKRDKHLERIKTSVKNLTSILNDFLSIDKLEDGKIEVNISNFAINELLNEAIEEMEPYLKNGQNITLNSTLKDEELVHSDKNVIKNILINLLSNASKYSDEGKMIKLDLITKKNDVVIDVTDFGVGIPQAEQNKLFSRFFRAANVFNIQGTGLGLTIVKKYLSLLNGTITFESEENKGTTFSITIPNIIL